MSHYIISYHIVLHYITSYHIIPHNTHLSYHHILLHHISATTNKPWWSYDVGLIHFVGTYCTVLTALHTTALYLLHRTALYLLLCTTFFALSYTGRTAQHCSHCSILYLLHSTVPAVHRAAPYSRAQCRAEQYIQCCAYCSALHCAVL
jgi:hypothetical protein